MAFENMTNDEKIRLINLTISNLEMSLYSSLTFIGIDPETFDINSFQDNQSSDDLVKYAVINDIIKNIKFNQNLLSQIQ